MTAGQRALIAFLTLSFYASAIVQATGCAMALIGGGE